MLRGTEPDWQDNDPVPRRLAEGKGLVDDDGGDLFGVALGIDAKPDTKERSYRQARREKASQLAS
ncbi:MAG: hypothetical protein JO028_13820 [Acidobacteriaceae bacterium]|nr:hypothetical protein [Acidobacteriaceae bacterium]